MNLKQIMLESIKEKLNENIFTPAQVKKITNHGHEVDSNTPTKSTIVIDIGGGTYDIHFSKTKSGFESESDIDGKTKFRSADAFVKYLINNL